MDSSPDRCRICAVVGNSVNLLGSRYGPLIDIHDVVIRFNKALTVGYEEDVGNKTTLHMMYPESSVDLDNNTHLMFVPIKTKDLQWLVKVLHPGFIKYVHHIWLDGKGYYPSTGLMGVMLAMHICDEVNVFGFGADKDGNWRHYWEELVNKRFRTGHHSGGREYNVL
ncbi:hypothetical protein CRUP_003154, partial [Coryphaenoides rupestris]